MKTHQGSITVMLILVLCAVIMAVTLVVEVARIRIAEGQAKRAVDMAIFSALAAYDQDTKDSYGLFYRYGTEGLEEEIRDGVEKSLLINDGSSAWQPYEYKVEAIEVRVLFPLSNQESIKHQILEYMKYRAPKNLIGDSAEKLSAFFCMQSTAGVMKADLAVDRKIKAIADKIQDMKRCIATVSNYSDDKLSNFNGHATQVSEKAAYIKSLETRLGRLRLERDERTSEDQESIRNLQEQIEVSKEEMSEVGRAVLQEILPILEANRQALGICKELQRLGPEAETAIKAAEAMMAEKKNLVQTFKDDLSKKYVDYRQYCDIKNLKSMESDLQNNIRLLEPKVEMLEDVLSGKAYGGRPSIFETRGYRSVMFTNTGFRGSPDTPAGNSVNITPEVIRKLVSVAQKYREEIKHTATTTDTGPIRNCPGNQFEEVLEEPRGSSGDGYEEANDSLAGTYDRVGGDVDADSLIEALAGGTLKVSKEIYESLLINEYVLETFNNRKTGGREKCVLEETEVEYVLVGNSVPKINAGATQLEIIAWRTVFNAVSFGYYCPEISRSIDGAALSLNGLTGVPYPVWKGILTGTLSFIESVADTKRLLITESIPLFKFKARDVSIVRELQDITCELGLKDPTGNNKDNKETVTSTKGKADVPTKNLEVNYKDHLRAMLMYRSLLGQNDKMLRRIQDVIYTNILDCRRDYDPLKHFNFIEVDARFSIKSFFPAISSVNAHIDGIPMRHILSVECGRGY